MQNLSVTPCDQTHKIVFFQNPLHSLAFLESLNSSSSVPLPAPLPLLFTSNSLEHTLLANCLCSCFSLLLVFLMMSPTCAIQLSLGASLVLDFVLFSWLLFWVKGPSMWPYSLLCIPEFSNLWFGIEMMCVSCLPGRLFFSGEGTMSWSLFIHKCLDLAHPLLWQMLLSLMWLHLWGKHVMGRTKGDCEWDKKIMRSLRKFNIGCHSPSTCWYCPKERADKLPWWSSG